ncbi:MAG: hypothetical protein GF383_00170, partial [Candidatus Lokiarchaeota archaeon]|nr:hypothetical protein [Candidatus Lokiarchaeota archaeon]MBD3337509.1 hypothetical protein [Candidatus Lokiarchaeota archaeon]
MALELIVVMNGIFSLLFFTINSFIGLKIAYKYRAYRDKILLYVGFVWIGMGKPWLASSVSFIVLLLTGIVISAFLYIVLNFVLISMVVIVWFIAVNSLISLSGYKVVFPLFSLCVIIFDVFIFYFLFTEIEMLAVYVNPVDMDLGILLIVYLFINLVVFIVLGFLFAANSLRSENPEVKLKGKFLLLAFILYLLGAALHI